MPCTATTRAGNPCRARPLEGEDYCAAHHPNPGDKTRFRPGAQPGAGRPKTPRMVDVIRERMEAELDDWWQVALDARDADRAVVVGNSSTAHVELVPDHSTRLAALREVLDRAYGKAKQTQEVSGPDGGPVETVTIVPVDAEERSARAAALLKRHGHVST